MNLKKLGRYEVIRVIGKGAMGMVYEGVDPNLDRRVALKTIRVENLTDEEAQDYETRFRTEAKSAARLHHPNIVSVFDSDRDIDVAYLVMEFVEGQDLKHHFDRGNTFSLAQTLTIMSDLLSALDYAHRHNVIHRDIKPANLLIQSNGRIKLTDFGVARIQDSGDLTRSRGSIIGTLKYMSPEQVQGLTVDSRTDLFAAGVVLYQLLTGIRPFEAENDFEIIQKIVNANPTEPSRLNPQLPTALDTVLSTALAKAREDRFSNAEAFSAALNEAAGQAMDPTVSPTPKYKPSLSFAATNPSNHTIPGSAKPDTVTQEVELVYWKEIKDSEDINDFEGFLSRFPNGIYADLARRNIKRLFSAGSQGQHAATLPGSPEPTATLIHKHQNQAHSPVQTLSSHIEPAPPAPEPSLNNLTPSAEKPRNVGWAVALVLCLALIVSLAFYLTYIKPVLPPKPTPIPSPAQLKSDGAKATDKSLSKEKKADKPAPAENQKSKDVLLPEEAPARLNIDAQFNKRGEAECQKGLAGLLCREKIRYQLCDKKWHPNPPQGQSICTGSSAGSSQ